MRFITADKIFNGKEFLPNDAVLVLGDRDYFVEIADKQIIGSDKIERLEGTITPGFVNAHCHLELSHLKTKIPEHTGLPEFARQVILQRNKFSTEQIAEAQKEADREMWNNGIVAVGDISNGEESFERKSNSNIFYYTFVELIGLNPANATLIFERGSELFQKLSQYQLKGSLVPHAPYSTSRELIKKIANFDADQQLTFSIHNQESMEELKFFQGQKSAFDELYRFLNLDTSWFVAPKTSSLKNYVDVLTEQPSLLVHNTFTTAEDIRSTRSKNVYWCFCPCANQYIENSLPAFELFNGLENKICLGTDSLAGNHQLNLISELNCVLQKTPAFNLETLLRTVTFNPAEALGLTASFGQFINGRNAGLNLLKLQNNQLIFIKKLA